MSGQDQNKFVRTLQKPAAVVTYRAVVGALAAATMGLVSLIGRDILDGITKLQDSMLQVQISVSRNSGRIDGQDSRLGRVELSVDNLAEKAGSLDHRVTVIEARQGPK